MPASRRLVAVLALVALFATVFGAACSGGDDDGAKEPESEKTTIVLDSSNPPAFHGVRVTPALPKPEVVLTDTSGEPYDLAAETEGYVTLFYLGYTHCPDICPTHMADMAAALDSLDPAVAERVKVVFVTTDPERDTPEAMRKWLDLFDEDFVGLTGSQEVLDAVQRSLGVNPATKTDLGDGNYAVNHAAYVMAFGTDNLAHLVYPGGMTQADYEHDLEKLVEEGWTEQ